MPRSRAAPWPWRMRPFDLAAVIDAAVQIDAGRAHEKGLDIAAVVDPALPVLVVGDAARVRLIVRKLLSNAITFTDTGSVLVRAAAAAGGGVRIEFEDTGVGVRAGTTLDLFEAFVQGDTSTTRRHGGMGLGLAIGRRLTEAMGGTIGVDGLGDAGSRFWVELPLLSGDAAPAYRRRRRRSPAGARWCCARRAPPASPPRASCARPASTSPSRRRRPAASIASPPTAAPTCSSSTCACTISTCWPCTSPAPR